MYIHLTEKEMESKLNSLQTPKNVIGWLLDNGLELRVEDIDKGVYRRTWGMDMAEWDGRIWEGFNPACHGAPVDFTMDKDICEWTLVLDQGYRPVWNGVTIALDSEGRRVY